MCSSNIIDVHNSIIENDKLCDMYIRLDLYLHSCMWDAMGYVYFCDRGVF